MTQKGKHQDTKYKSIKSKSYHIYEYFHGRDYKNVINEAKNFKTKLTETEHPSTLYPYKLE